MIKLLLHHILVRLDEPELKTASGIILSLDEKKERKAVEYGVIVQVGPTAFIDYGRTPDIVKIGDRICLNRYSGKEVIDSDDTSYVILNDQDVLCVLE
mgnify:CR=1 FL=1